MYESIQIFAYTLALNCVVGYYDVTDWEKTTAATTTKNILLRRNDGNDVDDYNKRIFKSMITGPFPSSPRKGKSHLKRNQCVWPFSISLLCSLFFIIKFALENFVFVSFDIFVSNECDCFSMAYIVNNTTTMFASFPFCRDPVRYAIFPYTHNINLKKMYIKPDVVGRAVGYPLLYFAVRSRHFIWFSGAVRFEKRALVQKWGARVFSSTQQSSCIELPNYLKFLLFICRCSSVPFTFGNDTSTAFFGVLLTGGFVRIRRMLSFHRKVALQRWNIVVYFF